MLGLLHPGHAGTGPGVAVLMLNPWGQEAIRSHRLFRTLADRLSREGHTVLRFDYHGCGDSPGEDEDGDLRRWREDLLAADALLRSEAPGAPRIWFGLNLGASLAIGASQLTAHPPERLLLWSPIVDGRKWMALLERAHRRHLEAAFGLRWQAIRRLIGRDPDPGRGESQGFTLSPTLIAELEGLDAKSLGAARAGRIALIARPDETLDGWLDLHPGDLAERLDFSGIDWNTEEAGNSALAPPELLAWVVAQCRQAGQPADA